MKELKPLILTKWNVKNVFYLSIKDKSTESAPSDGIEFPNVWKQDSIICINFHSSKKSSNVG